MAFRRPRGVWRAALALALVAATAPALVYPSALLVDSMVSPDPPELSIPTPEPAAEPSIEVVFPAPHSWWQVDEATGRLAELPVFFALRNFRIPEDGHLRVTGEKIFGERHGESAGFIWRENVSSFIVSEFEPGSFFLTFSLVQRSGHDGDRGVGELAGIEHVVASTVLHLEVVVPITSSPMLTYAPADPHAPPPLRRMRLDPRSRRPSTASPPPPTPLCYLLTTKGGFDGQKKMWLQLIEALSAPRPSAHATQENDDSDGHSHWTPSFRVEALTFDGIVPDSLVLQSLEKLGVTLKGGAQLIEIEQLQQANVSVDRLEETVIERFYAEFPEANPLSHANGTHRKLSTRDQSRLANLRPRFVRDALRGMVELLQTSCTGGIVVTSNSRSATDKLVVSAARLAGARVVMELANLFPSHMEADALFAPSRFALRHPSVVSNLRADRSFAVSTGVNTNVFAPEAAEGEEARDHNELERAFVVGYVGRLNTDKSVGVLIAAAKALRRSCSMCKLRLIGDGVLKPHLMALAAEWGLLESVVEFVDGIFNDEPALAAELRKMHAYATPALETLGISVLEAMSTGLPVVGFVMGGTAEFLVDGFNCVSVRERSPEAFSDAIMALVRDPKLRMELGRNARRTIERRFSRDESIREIAMLYQSLAQQEE